MAMAEQLHGSAPDLSKSISISTRLGGFFLFASLGYGPSGGWWSAVCLHYGTSFDSGPSNCNLAYLEVQHRNPTH